MVYSISKSGGKKPMSAQTMFESTEYKYGFVTSVETEAFPKGLSEEIITKLSHIKEEPEWLLDFRLKAYRKLHRG